MKVGCAAEALTQRRSQRGFTLVEIAIVLVIIGLLLGGILKGQEMINQAKIKNLINDMNGIVAAVHSYQDRYRALPGDDANAGARWTTTSPANTVVSGGGNGQFAGAYGAAATATLAATQESNLFWWHLRLAGFVQGPTAAGVAAGTQPPNSVNGIVGVQTAGLGFTANILCSSNVPDKLAIPLDVQLDDGASGTGQVRGLLITTTNLGAVASGSTAETAYAETGSNQYVLCKTL